jgi:hypothetical protein
MLYPNLVPYSSAGTCADTMAVRTDKFTLRDFLQDAKLAEALADSLGDIELLSSSYVIEIHADRRKHVPAIATWSSYF